MWLLGSLRSLGFYSEDSGGSQGGNSPVLFAFVSTFVGSWSLGRLSGGGEGVLKESPEGGAVRFFSSH